MAVAFDAQSSAVTTANAATSFTNSTRLTVGSGVNRALLVMIQWSTSTAPTGVSITWNGVALTLVPGTSKSNGLDCNVAIYGLVNPASGTLTLAGSWTGSKDYSVVGVAYTGVDQRGGATSFPNGNTAGATSTAASVTITSATGNAVVGTIASDDVLSVISGTTIFNGTQSSLTYDACANRNVGAATVAVSCTVASASPWAAAGCDILAAAVVFDAKSTADASGAAATSFSVATLTVGADPNRALTVLMAWGGSTAPTGVSITWNGAALTLVGNTSVANTNGNVAIYALLNPTSGAQTLAGSWTGAQDFYMEAVSWSGVDQTSVAVAFPNGNTSTGSTTGLSLTVNSAVGNATVSIDVSKNNSGTNNQTLLFFDNVNLTDAMGQWAVGAPSVTFTSTSGTAGPWAMSGCDILLASVGAAVGAAAALVAPLLGLPAHYKFAVPRGPFDLLFSPTPASLPASNISNPLTLVIACTTAVTNSVLVSKILAVSSVTAITLTKSISKTVSIASATAVSVTKAVSKFLSIASTTAVSVIKQVGKVLSIAAATAVSVIALKVRLVAITIACTTAVSLTKQVGKQIAISSVTTLSLTKRGGKIISIASATAVSVTKAVNKFLSIASATAVTVTAFKVRLVAITITCSTAVSSLTKQVGKQLALSSVTALSLTKAVGKIVSIASTTTATATAIKVKIVNVAITCTTTVTKALSVGKLVPIASATALTLANSVGKRCLIASTTAVSAIKAVGKRLTIASTTTVSAIVSRAFLITLSIASTTAVTTKRSVGKALSLTSATSLSLAKNVAKKLAISSITSVSATAFRFAHLLLTIAVTTSVSGSRSAGKQITIAATTAVNAARAISKTLVISCVTALTRIVQSSVVLVTNYARVIIGKATMANIIGQPEQPIIGAATIVNIVGQASDPVTIAPSAPLVITGSPMTTVHDPQDFVCGDNWQFTGPLQDATGVALNLTGATIQWKLDTADGLANILTLDNAAIGGVSVITPATATILVNVTAVQSRAIAPGTYRDWLRVTLATGVVLTEWTGVIRADQNPA